MKRFRLLAALAVTLLALGALTPTAGQAQVIYRVTVDTSPLAGTSGNVSVQFNPGDIDTPAASAGITGTLSDGSFDPTATYTGSASGRLQGSPEATIANTELLNEVYQGFGFGSFLQFDVTFSGAALSPTLPFAPAGSTFALSFYNAAGDTALLTNAADGAVARIFLAPQGTFSFETSPDETATNRVTVQLLAIATPEPASVTLLVLTGALVAAFRLRRCRRRPRTRS